MSFQIKTTWSDLKGFVDSTQLYVNLNYIEFPNHYVIWMDYENASVWTQIDKSDIRCEDFVENYIPKTILKKTILDNGVKHLGIQGILDKKYARSFSYQGITAVQTNPEYFFTISILDSNGDETTSENACCTMIRFEPNYDYDVLGGSFEIIDYQHHTEEIFVNVVGNPDIPVEMGGTVQVITNEKYLDRIVGIESKESMPLRYFEGLHTNVIVIYIKHPVGFQVPYQAKMMFYAKSI